MKELALCRCRCPRDPRGPVRALESGSGAPVFRRGPIGPPRSYVAQPPRDDGLITRGSLARGPAGYTAGRSATPPRPGAGASRPTPRSPSRRCADRPAGWRSASPAAAGDVSTDLLTELRAEMEGGRGLPQEEGHALAVQEIAERLRIPWISGLLSASRLLAAGRLSPKSAGTSNLRLRSASPPRGCTRWGQRGLPGGSGSAARGADVPGVGR